MKIYDEELKGYEAYCSEHHNGFPLLTDTQINEVIDESRKLKKKVDENRNTHNTINLLIILMLLASLIISTFLLPEMLGAGLVTTSISAIVFGWLSYGLTTFTLHEGSGHEAIIYKTNSFWTTIAPFINNLCRLNFADPEYYLSKHVWHHTQTGTPVDGAFTQFVLPKRFFLSLLPFAGALPIVDYKIHAGPVKTRSRTISELIGGTFYLFIFVLHFAATDLILALLFIIISTWVSFTLDRLRETTEHNLMPHYRGGNARSFGPGFWGLLVGGGPWGQPCHLAHHLAPSLPWYQQIRLHHFYKNLMTQEQRKTFLLTPFIGYPLLLCQVVIYNIKYTRKFHV